MVTPHPRSKFHANRFRVFSRNLADKEKFRKIAASCGLSELAQNVIVLSHGHSTPSLEISCKSVQSFSRNLGEKEISIAKIVRFTGIDRKCNQLVPWLLHTFPENFMQIGPVVFS